MAKKRKNERKTKKPLDPERMLEHSIREMAQSTARSVREAKQEAKRVKRKSEQQNKRLARKIRRAAKLLDEVATSLESA